MLSEVLRPLLEQMNSSEYVVPGRFVVALILAVFVARLRAAALADFKTYNKIWQPVGATLTGAPSPSDTVINGLRAAVRGAFRCLLVTICGFLAFDFALFQGNILLAILRLLGL